MLDALQAQHEGAVAQHEQVRSIDRLLQDTRAQLDKLIQLGDLVTPEDVIKGAGHLAGKGASPMELAKLLSDMPQDGPGLSNWLGQHEKMVTQREAQMRAASNATRHAMGLNAMRLLVAHAMGAPQTSGQPGPAIANAPAGANPLAPQGPSPAEAEETQNA